ncbi:MAG: hypothetical protein AAB873_03730 [Patescibacteria group bacterium]
MLCSLTPNTKFIDLVGFVICNINRGIIPLIIAVAMLTFIWGVVRFVINTDNETAQTKGKDMMIWGIVGLTAMFAVWGLVKILGTTFGIEYAIPQLK